MPPSTDRPEGAAGGDGATQAEFDRRFAELISGPDLEDLQRPAPPVPPAPDPAPKAPPAAGSGPRDYALAQEPDEPFRPPEPEPLGTADPIRLIAWTAAIAGPVLLLLTVVLWPTAPAVVWLSLLAATLVGWGVALSRLPRARDDDDDGAVV